MQPISPISVRSCDCSVLFFVVYLQGSELGSKCVCSTPAGSGGEKEGAREEVGLTNSWSPSWPQDLTPSDQQPGTETSAENPELRRLHKDSRRIANKFVLLLSFCYPFAILLPSVSFPFANRLLSFCDPIRLLSVFNTDGRPGPTSDKTKFQSWDGCRGRIQFQYQQLSAAIVSGFGFSLQALYGIRNQSRENRQSLLPGSSFIQKLQPTGRATELKTYHI